MSRVFSKRLLVLTRGMGGFSSTSEEWEGEREIWLREGSHTDISTFSLAHALASTCLRECVIWERLKRPAAPAVIKKARSVSCTITYAPREGGRALFFAR